MLVINRYHGYPELIKLREGFKVWFPGVNVIVLVCCVQQEEY